VGGETTAEERGEEQGSPHCTVRGGWSGEESTAKDAKLAKRKKRTGSLLFLFAFFASFAVDLFFDSPRLEAPEAPLLRVLRG